MKIIVTGGAGFIGSHIVDAYVQAGHEVVIVDDLSTGRTENLNPKARFVELDIRSAAARELVERERPDVLNHHAAQMNVRHSVADPEFDAAVNILGFLNLLAGARDGGVKRVIFASSGGAVYGEQERFPAPETHPTAPVSPYGVSKRAGELYLFYWHASYGIPYVALRYANVYGTRQDPRGEAGVVAIFTERLLRGEAPVINGDGQQTRDYVHVGDVVAANLAALETEYVGVVNIGTGIETDVNRLCALLRDAAGARVDATHGPGKPGEQRRSVVDPALARRVLGWAPSRRLEDGLREVVAATRLPASPAR
jgi:UDP-glucose 4-epimerase